MSALELPEQLKGPWDHALILSYGLDIPFFERALWYQFPTRCRNKIILADGKQYLQISDAYSQQRGLVRHMNQLYVVAGIFGLHNKDDCWLAAGICSGKATLQEVNYSQPMNTVLMLLNCYQPFSPCVNLLMRSYNADLSDSQPGDV